jgi:hypothetical protein
MSLTESDCSLSPADALTPPTLRVPTVRVDTMWATGAECA